MLFITRKLMKMTNPSCDIIRFKELKKDDEFLFLGIPYKVREVTKTQIYYSSVNATAGVTNPSRSAMGKNCMMLVNKLPKK